MNNDGHAAVAERALWYLLVMRSLYRTLPWMALIGVACGPTPDAPARDAGSGRDAARDAPDAGRAEADASLAVDAGAVSDPWECGPSLGARLHVDGTLEVRLHAPRATRVELALFAAPFGEEERLRVPLERGEEEGHWRGRVSAAQRAAAGLDARLYYGYRVWGPNWVFDESWEPGSESGRIADVDGDGNRMNPNKLVLDPYALEVSHDPIHAGHGDYGVYRTDPANRARDSGPFAPKGVVVTCETASPGPTRAMRDDIVYEVHLRGFTRSDPTVPEAERGTYAGAARRAAWLRSLGVTAIEFLPLHETPNDQNDLTDDARGDNYWGYSSLSFMAPDRRYASDQSPGGPTRELRAMIEAFHAEGIKVYVDVVYNHTAEGGGSGDAATILSWRGLDNAGFYELSRDGRGYVSSNGVGPNVNTVSALGREMVLASLRYWHETLGVDGFRFDLATVVANGCERECYRFDPSFPDLIAAEFAREREGGAGADLIAEPWGVVGGSYQLGRFPRGWSEWNDRYRDTLRADLNRLGVETVTLRDLVARLSGSPDVFPSDARPPSATLNFIVAHDGLTLYDLFHYDGKNNTQAWPYGPSDGGTDRDLAWSHAGDPVRQMTAQRSAMALLMLSPGVPMMTGGDESGRSLRANNNGYNLDSPANWLRWPGDPEYDEALFGFTSRLLAFRHAHAALRPASDWEVFTDADADGVTQVRWFRDDGAFVDDAYLSATDRHLLAWQLDGDELGDASASMFFVYNGWSGALQASVPAPPAGHSWRVVIDTGPAGDAFGWVLDAAESGVVHTGRYSIGARTVAALVAVRD